MQHGIPLKGICGLCAVAMTTSIAATGCATMAVSGSLAHRRISAVRDFPQRAFLTDDARLILASEGNFRLNGKDVSGPFHFIVPLNDPIAWEEEVVFLDLADYAPLPGFPTDQELATEEAVEIPVSESDVLLHSLEVDRVVKRVQDHIGLDGEAKDPAAPRVIRAQRLKPKPGGSAGFVFYSGDLFPPDSRILVGTSSDLETSGEKVTRGLSKLVTVPLDVVTAPIQIPFFLLVLLMAVGYMAE